MDRPTFPAIYMALARALAQRSTCEVEPVGTVITSVDFRKVLAIGYRGNASGLRNGCDVRGDGTQPCGCLHGEENAVIQCDAPRSEPKIVVSSKLPCRACAKRLINLGGVQDVYFPFQPGGEDVVDLLASVGIRTHVLE
jgi:deoxycytidylate deaminase